MADYALYEKPDFTDPMFPIRISHEHHPQGGMLFRNHWHEQIELLYFTQGQASIRFNSETFAAAPGDLLIANSNELHGGEGGSQAIAYYCMIIDTSVLHSSFIDYANPQSRMGTNRTLLANKIPRNRNVHTYMQAIIREEKERRPGYELAVKAGILRLLVHLIRNHAQKTLSSQKYDARLKNLERLNKVLKYIEANADGDIHLETACRLANLSTYYFCRVFKETTGKTFTEYVNFVRINKAELLLANTDMNITEVALSCGYDDINYFSRIFRKNKGIPPSGVRKA